jgi:hypothetical protein
MRSILAARTLRRMIPLCLVGLCLILFTLLRQAPAALAQQTAAGAAADSQVFLPLILRQGAATPLNNFNPVVSTQLGGGDHTFDDLTIPGPHYHCGQPGG